ncbi:type VI secretion system contractile sheath large subunit [Massilia sp. CCM 9210]|uniref:type VI secretion system contractile sheath large subunit n=1 Tax=Massilia scottii TaxID=3057166 RepID=UPI00279665E3|nr:type VI secretion system contractile sheath large subunit [Massilia sp. CCM 9210]MDQ1812064.1 type VI secretion system contractile sheath large subunit [Massilia sp. CCM 9210]
MTESIQKKLLRVRPPRVRITYDVETGGAMEKRELPFIVGILADLSGDRADDATLPPIKERRMIDIDRDKFNDVLKSCKPRVSLLDALKADAQLGALLATPQDRALTMQSLSDFEPMRIVQALPSLNAMYTARGQIRALQARVEADDAIAAMVDAWVIGDDPKAPDNDARVGQLRTELIKALAGGGAPDKSAQMRAVVRLLDQLAPAWNAASAIAAAPSDAELAELRSAGLLAQGDAAPQARALAQARIRAAIIVSALSKENSLTNRVKAQRLLGKSAEGAEPGAFDASDAGKTRSAALIPLGEEGQDFGVVIAAANTAQQDDPVWAKALLLLGLAAVQADTIAIVDSKAQQQAAMAADARDRMLDFVAYLGAQADQQDLAGESIFRLIEACLPDEAGKTLLRLHHLATQVLVRLQDADDAGNALLQSSARRGGAAAAIDERVVQIDQMLSTALSGIMHAESFQRMEATWRGLGYLVFNTETSTMLKLRVFNATKEELLKDMERAVEFDQSAIFKMIYEREYGSFGGTPYSLLVGDYRIGSLQADIDFLKKISEVAAAAHAPFLAAASEQLFCLPAFNSLDKPRDLKKIFEGDDMAAWREFREMEDARYVSLVLPRVLLRLPYGQPEKRNTIPCDGLNYEEIVADAGPILSPSGNVIYADPRNNNFLWGNPAYMLAERITNAFSLYNWTAAIRGVEGGGLVEGLPLYTYSSDTGMIEMFCPTEVAITDRREKELNDLGFISLCHCKGAGKAAFFGGQTTNQPKKYFSDDANANARISAMLPYILAASRFAHYIKVIMRDKIGSFLTRTNVEAYLNSWIANYVLLDDNAAQDLKAAFPLRSASVVVTDVPGEPGAYRATVFLKPHFQLEELTTSIRLVANLPK